MKRRLGITIFLSFALTSLPLSGHSDEYCSYTGGGGYEACHETVNMAPAIGLAAVALGVIVGFAFLKSGGSSHAHDSE